MSALEEILASSLPCRTVREDKLRGRLNHCYLVLTEDDAIRTKLCKMIAKIALCPNGGCGECDVCEKIDDGAYIALTVADKDKMSVEDVKLLIEDTFLTGFDGDLKAYVITNMQGMNEKAQNKFLKTLEEPSDGVVFILGAQSPRSVLATIFSRCKKLNFEGFTVEQLKETLEEETPWGVARDGLDREEVIERAAACAFGSYTRAKKLASDAEFARLFALVADILLKMTDSKKLDEQLARLAPYKNDLSAVLDMTETVLGLLLSGEGGGFDAIEGLKSTFDTASVVNSLGLVASAKRKVESNCNAQSVLDALFLGILEVKYLCRR
ncbi:MAG TPA: hypothetical protein IAB15_04515 [Candidatus Ornithoclostridium faecigallinarum]|nr:hypothetical protein [Candidatus Ornithoclostridium faecigallinarum]